MKKTVFALGGVIVVIVAVALFFMDMNQPNSPAPDPPQITEVSLYHYFSGSLSGGIEEMVERVNLNSTGQRIASHSLDHEAFKTMIHSTIATGSPPELFSYWAGARTQALVDKGQLEPFDEKLWGEIQGNDRFPEAIVKAASTYNGKKYLVPITQHFVVFFFNKKLFTDFDMVVPASWDEFLEICQTLAENNTTALALGARERWPAQFWFDYLLLRTAGAKYRMALMKGEHSYTDQEVVRVYTIWADMLERGFFNKNANNLNWEEAVELVCKGDAAMTLMGTWAIPLLSGENCNLKEAEDFDYFVFPVLDEKIPSSSVGPIDGLVLTKESTQHELAKRALAFFAKTDSQQILSRGSGALSPSRGVPVSFYSPFKQKLLHEVRSSPDWAFNYDLATPPLVAEKGMDSFVELVAFPQQYMEILHNLQQEIEKMLARNPSVFAEK